MVVAKFALPCTIGVRQCVFMACGRVGAFFGGRTPMECSIY
ncbi:hypothetical protein HMPREF3232_00887 [Fannyhessea vaginae]|nr:hypothetical protein HMPREF3232_00887 [Fannyhessea vaginae]